MTYMGSKSRYTKYILPLINKYIKENSITDFYDIFCGGMNMSDKIECENIYCNDLSPTLISLHRQAQNNFSEIPEDGNREWWDEAYTEYKRLMKNFPIDIEIWEKESVIPLWKIGAIEWYSSFSNGGFPRGYAKNSQGRNYYNEAYRNHKKQKSLTSYKKAHFIQGDYQKTDIPPNALIYSDSPYKNTKPYGINPKFNHEEYYNWLREKSKTNPIFISEQKMPNDFQIIWQKETNRTAGQNNNFKAIETLFFIDNRN